MEIKIFAFGRIAEITGKELAVAASDTESLREILDGRFPELSTIKYAVAVNKKLADGNTELKAGDTVALMPPYSGG